MVSSEEASSYLFDDFVAALIVEICNKAHLHQRRHSTDYKWKAGGAKLNGSKNPNPCISR